MPTLDKATNGPRVTAVVPDGWYTRDTCVPNLLFPYELFGISNEPIPLQRDLERSQPAVDSLSVDAILIWCFYQMPDAPPGLRDPDPMPDYAAAGGSFDYYGMWAYSPREARGWDGGQVSWRRIGARRDNTWVTVHLWEGSSVSADDLDRARAVIASIRIS